jgi:peptidylprolyl isomerase
MNKYVSAIIVVALIIFGIWFSLKDKGGEENITNSNNQIKKMTAILHTNQGDITIELFDKATPNTVANFTKLAKEGFYNGVKFHRVIKGFMIQGGDPLTKDDSKVNLWGTGGPGYAFPDELGGTNANNKNDAGTISMANSGANTNGSQFFINTAPNNFLDGKHVVFGKVVSGMDTVTKIENTPTTGSPFDRPLSPMVIESITVK